MPPDGGNGDIKAVGRLETGVYFDADAESVTIMVNAPAEPQQVIQEVSLVEGWNLISLYAQTQDMTPSGIFTGHFDVIEEMRTLKGVFNTSWPEFLNSIKTIEFSDSYWVKASAARSGIRVTGSPPTSTVIEMQEGWNLIGFPSVGEQETVDVFQSLSDQNAVDRIIGTGEFYTFDGNAIFNTLDTLKPGNGYWVKMNQASSLTVNNASERCPERRSHPHQSGRTIKVCRDETDAGDLSVCSSDLCGRNKSKRETGSTGQHIGGLCR